MVYAVFEIGIKILSKDIFLILIYISNIIIFLLLRFQLMIFITTEY